ncbi:MAG: zinc ribbon domain-containing protein [Leptolyngbya sp. Prado105]|jgi:NADH pyrophosphatase NudC (nudix superfamily)|nr:zinc ribbon domain-containing protein [Leptolyngbya sp. Prado105]
MTYSADLGQGQSLTIENVGVQTVITWAHRSAGQQQSQQMSLSLGAWSEPPKLFKNHVGFILQIESARTSYLRLQANGISLLSEVPLMIGTEEIPFQRVTSNPSRMPDMKPLEPLRMGNMSMRMEPMEMNMGNMNLRMATATSHSSSTSHAQFCSQCGTKIKESDRFCSQCGTKLES